MLLIFTVPGEVRGQARPRTTIRGGHATIYETAEDKSYKGLIQFHAMNAMRIEGYDSPIPSGDRGFDVRISIRKAVPKSFSKKKAKNALFALLRPQTKPDLDNVAKIFLDALNGVVWKDDKSVVQLHVSKEYAEADSAYVTIRMLDGDENGKEAQGR